MDDTGLEKVAAPSVVAQGTPSDHPAPPEASAKVSPPARARRGWVLVLVIAVAVLAMGWARSYFGARTPVHDALAKDSRNSGVELSARYRAYWDSSVLVLDVVRADHVSPLDMYRVLFQSAEAMHVRRTRFEEVRLARRGKTVFVLDGADFATLGEQFANSENPVFMIRKLPQKLKRPDGSAAFSEWDGGWLGVLQREMEDANSAATEWVGGKPP